MTQEKIEALQVDGTRARIALSRAEIVFVPKRAMMITSDDLVLGWIMYTISCPYCKLSFNAREDVYRIRCPYCGAERYLHSLIRDRVKEKVNHGKGT